LQDVIKHLKESNLPCYIGDKQALKYFER